jgi:hypothetical protein
VSEIFITNGYVAQGEEWFNVVKAQVSANRVKVLPDEIAQLVHLRSLDCSNNLIAALPSAFFERCTKIEKLDFSGNKVWPNPPPPPKAAGRARFDFSDSHRKYSIGAINGTSDHAIAEQHWPIGKSGEAADVTQQAGVFASSNRLAT